MLQEDPQREYVGKGVVSCSHPNLAGLAYKVASNTTSVRATGAVGVSWAIVMGAEVDCSATKGAAVVDERLVFLDGHFVQESI